LFHLFHQQYAERQGKRRWGDQTELIEEYAAAIFAAYPSAQIIHMIRDPRDRFEALCARDLLERDRLGKATATWLYSEALARQNQYNFPGHYKVVRYESMVSQPEETLRDVCQFLGEEFVPAMLTMAHEPRFQQHTPYLLGESPLSTRFVGRYRTGLFPREVAFIQAHTGALMNAYAYKPEPISLTTAEKLRFWEQIYHKLQMRVWSIWHWTQSRPLVGHEHKSGLGEQTAVPLATRSSG
jgi:hypothetical protein